MGEKTDILILVAILGLGYWLWSAKEEVAKRYYPPRIIKDVRSRNWTDEELRKLYSELI